MSRRASVRVAATALIATFVLLAFPPPADAHPLGNFTVNRYARVEPVGDLIRVTYVLDQAEIPTFQEQKMVDADSDAFARTRADEIQAGLRLTVDGRAVPLERKQYLLDQPEGQGGLPVLRLAVVYEAAAPPEGSLHDAVFEDSNQPDRIGWREIVVRGQGNATVSGSNAPTTDLTNELRSYPTDLIQAPLDLRQVTFRFDPGTETLPAQGLVGSADAPTRADGGFAGLLKNADPGPVALGLLFVLALGFGAVHGLAPGHGKSVMAAYLVGTRGRPIDALLLGVLVSIMHTGSVLVVGLVLLKIGSEADIAKVYPVLTLSSGLIVLLLGSVLIVTRIRGLRRTRNRDHHDHHDHVDLTDAHEHAHHHEVVAAGATSAAHSHGTLRSGSVPHDHDHDHDDHHHVHATGTHSHGFGSHSHDLPDGIAPLSRRGIVLLATSGGLLPSPSAVIVLIGAATTGRLTLGLGLIAAFSIGLAAMLTAIGLALVYGRGFMERSESRIAIATLRVLPVASACALLVAGVVVTIEGVHGLQ